MNLNHTSTKPIPLAMTPVIITRCTRCMTILTYDRQQETYLYKKNKKKTKLGIEERTQIEKVLFTKRIW